MDKLLKKIEELERRVEVLEEKLSSKTIAHTSTPTSRAKSRSPKEFLLTYKPQGEVAITFFLGCYAEQVAMTEAFSAVDLKQLFRAARVRVPININAVIDKNVAKGLFTEAAEKKGGKKAWVISLSGEEFYKRHVSQNPL